MLSIIAVVGIGLFIFVLLFLLNLIKNKLKDGSPIPLAIIIVTVFTFLMFALLCIIYTTMDNFDSTAHRRIRVTENQIVGLDGHTPITLNFVVHENNRRWGMQRIIFDLRRLDEMQMGQPLLIDSTEELFSYRLFGDRNLELFSFEFEPLTEYILRIYINNNSIENRIAQIRLYGLP